MTAQGGERTYKVLPRKGRNAPKRTSRFAPLSSFGRSNRICPRTREARRGWTIAGWISGNINVLKLGGRWIDAPSDCGRGKPWIDLFHMLCRSAVRPGLDAVRQVLTTQ